MYINNFGIIAFLCAAGRAESITSSPGLNQERMPLGSVGSASMEPIQGLLSLPTAWDRYGAVRLLESGRLAP